MLEMDDFLACILKQIPLQQNLTSKIFIYGLHEEGMMLDG